MCCRLVSEDGGPQRSKLMRSPVTGCCVMRLSGMKWGRKEAKNEAGSFLRVPAWASCEQGGNEVSSLSGSHVLGPPSCTQQQGWASVSFFNRLRCFFGLFPDPIAGDFYSSPRKHPVTSAVTQWKSCLHCLDLFSLQLHFSDVAVTFPPFFDLLSRQETEAQSSAIIILKKSVWTSRAAL